MLRWLKYICIPRDITNYVTYSETCLNVCTAVMEEPFNIFLGNDDGFAKGAGEQYETHRTKRGS